MIFQHTWQQVLSENKTQTRRIIHPGDTANRVRYNRIAAIHCNGREKWRVGQTYAVQPGRGQRQVARIRITRITKGQASRISRAAVEAEGFASRREFLQVWEAIHGPRSQELAVWVLEFELVAISIDVKASLPYHEAKHQIPATLTLGA